MPDLSSLEDLARAVAAAAGLIATYLAGRRRGRRMPLPELVPDRAPSRWEDCELAPSTMAAEVANAKGRLERVLDHLPDEPAGQRIAGMLLVARGGVMGALRELEDVDREFRPKLPPIESGPKAGS